MWLTVCGILYSGCFHGAEFSQGRFISITVIICQLNFHAMIVLQKTFLFTHQLTLIADLCTSHTRDRMAVEPAAAWDQTAVEPAAWDLVPRQTNV